MSNAKQERTIKKLGKEQSKLDEMKAKMDALAEEMKNKEKEIAALKEEQRIQVATELLDIIEKAGLTAEAVEAAVKAKDLYSLQEQLEGKPAEKVNTISGGVDADEESADEETE